MHNRDTVESTYVGPGSVRPPQHERIPRLVILTGPQTGRKVPLSSSLVLGRGDDADVRIPHQSVSRAHARIMRAGDGYVVHDLGSSNGTYVNGVRVESKELAAGDRIQLGARVVLQLTVEDPLDEMLLEAQKMEAIGRLSSGVTHDFNNLLAVLLANSAYLRELEGEVTLNSAEVRECLSEMEVAIRQAADLTSKLGNFVRGQGDVHERVDLSALCHEVVRLVRRVVPASIEIRADITPGISVVGSRTNLHQLLMNPCVNARDAMPQGGTLTLSLKLLPGKQGTGARLMADETYAVVSITDTGQGMSPEVAKKVFDPFFTTKSEGVGTGLGLATVSRVAKEHGGEVSLETQPGEGTTVQVYLPGHRATQRRTEAKTLNVGDMQLRPPPLRKVHILLVDDEPRVARSTGRWLQRAGHKVTYARDGVEALECYEAMEPRPDLVLLDVDMPRMDGEACYEELRQRDPEANVIFFSGQRGPTQERILRTHGTERFVRKPFEPSVLQQAIQLAVGS